MASDDPRLGSGLTSPSVIFSYVAWHTRPSCRSRAVSGACFICRYRESPISIRAAGRNCLARASVQVDEGL